MDQKKPSLLPFIGKRDDFYYINQSYILEIGRLSMPRIKQALLLFIFFSLHNPREN
jgi:hypothetical protein